MYGKFTENIKESNNGSRALDRKSKDVSLESGSPSKDLVEGISVATCTTNKAPTNCGKSIVIKTVDLAYCFLNLSSAGTSEAHDDL
jgi:hypothetical protein